MGDFQLSLCAEQIKKKKPHEDWMQIFQEKLVSFEQFSKDPLGIIANKNLLVKIDAELYAWEIAAPIILARCIFSRDLQDTVVSDILSKKKAWHWTKLFYSKDKAGLVHTQKTQEKQGNPSGAGTANNPRSDTEAGKVPKVFRKLEFREEEGADNSDESNKPQPEPKARPQKVFRHQTLNPKSELLKKFNLRFGCNKVNYILEEHNKKKNLEGYIFFWSMNTQIVVSDIDGTITK